MPSRFRVEVEARAELRGELPDPGRDVGRRRPSPHVAGEVPVVHVEAEQRQEAEPAGTGQGAIVNQDDTLNGPDTPAVRGAVVSIYGTGEGQTAPPGVDGSIVERSSLRHPVLPVRAMIGGKPAEVVYAGSAPDQVSGLFQVNVRVPLSVEPGDKVPVTISVGQRASQGGVTMSVR